MFTLLTWSRDTGAESGKGLKAKEVLLVSSKKFSLTLLEESKNIMELLPLPFGTNWNFPVVGDGWTYNRKDHLV